MFIREEFLLRAIVALVLCVHRENTRPSFTRIVPISRILDKEFTLSTRCTISRFLVDAGNSHGWAHALTLLLAVIIGLTLNKLEYIVRFVGCASHQIFIERHVQVR